MSADRRRAGPEYLLCPPDHFGAHFLFNPWMTCDEEIVPDRAAKQWERLRAALERHGPVRLMEPHARQSALVFTRDGALVFGGDRVLILRSFGPRGKSEPRILRSWFRRNGYRVNSVPRGMHLEGGNLLRFDDRTYVAGWKPGDSAASYRWLSGFLRREIHPDARLVLVRLANVKYLHLDMVIAPLAGRGFLVYPGGLNPGENWRESSIWGGLPVIPIARTEAERFGANAVVAGKTVITGGVSDSTASRIAELGFEVERIDLSEFYKAGGGAHCLSLDLVGTSHDRRT